ncbi:hypothetical protein XE97_25390, partial [Salmonella enterica subsp. enterica serovar Senftenberg]|nr:hypothetical protein [Salmonella enterica subsp. enterica serovar Senftenberg]
MAWQDIIDFYYPGTTQGTIGNSTIKVRVASLGSAVEAYAASGLSITWNQTDVFPLTTTKDGKTIARWRINPGTKVAGTPTRFRLEYLPAGSSTWLLYGNAPVSGTGAFVNPTSGTVLTRRGSDQVLYRGQVRAVLVGADGAESLVPVVALPMESYLRTVV